MLSSVSCSTVMSNLLMSETYRWSVRLSPSYAKIRSVFLCWWEKFSLLSHLINLRLVLSYSQNSHGLWKQFSLFHAVILLLFWYQIIQFPIHQNCWGTCQWTNISVTGCNFKGKYFITPFSVLYWKILSYSEDYYTDLNIVSFMSKVSQYFPWITDL